MKKTFVLCLVAVFAVASFATIASAKKATTQEKNFYSAPAPDAFLPPDLDARYGGALRSSAAADTFVLHDEDFDTPGGQPDMGGYTQVDITQQLKAFFHVALGNGELDGGTFGNLQPINGNASMWCGEPPSSTVPFCGYASLPGYGNGWDQILHSTTIAGDSIRFSYNVFFDSEPGYDGTKVQYTFDGGGTWLDFAITDTVSARPGYYDGGPAAFSEVVSAGSPGAANVQVRFRFNADGAWSDEDGLWPTDGAVIVDDLSIQTYSGGAAGFNNTEDFEGAAEGANAVGIWTGEGAQFFGDYSNLYPGVLVLQEDPCLLQFSNFWGFFDTAANNPYTCHVPFPEPSQGAMPFGDKDNNLYMSNEIWSPTFANTGSGVEYRLHALAYRDLPLINLQFYIFHVRSWTAGCPGTWKDDNFVNYGGQKDWLNTVWDVGSYIDSNADELQVAVGAVDQCGVWCGVYGDGVCHSHAPLLDNVYLERIAIFGPQYQVRMIDLLQDNFPDDGTVTGTARVDMANDILPAASPGIMPGDSTAITISPVTEIGAGQGPNAYIYVNVAGKSGASLGSSDTRVGKAGLRYPYGGSQNIGGVLWEKFQMDSAITAAGAAVADRYCADLNDALFTPGDVVHYFFGADVDNTPNNGNENYWHRTLNGQGAGEVTPDIAEAAASPCEFTILPTMAGGEGDILYVDDSDDRGGPAELYFDSAFDMLSISGLIDRYDVLGPSSAVANGPASRVKDNVAQVIDVYRKIIWNSTNLTSGLVGDGTGNPEKSNDFGLLEQFIRTSDLGPGLYLSGDNIAQEWVTLLGAGAVNLKDQFIPFSLIDGSHINHGEAVSPELTASGASFIHSGTPDELVAYGGCALVNDFDVIQPLANADVTTIIEFPYPNSGDGAVVSAQALNAATPDPQTYTIVLSGFSYTYIRDVGPLGPGQTAIARVEHLRDILIKMGNIVPEATGVKDDPTPNIRETSLSANYPNPFNPTTTIKYSIKEQAHVSLKVYNAAGQLVRTLVDQVQAPTDVKPVTWDGANNAGQTVSSGVYFYKLVTKNFAQTRKMVLLK
jgi:hypothetical protein